MILMVMDDWICDRCKNKQNFSTNGLYTPHKIKKPSIQICEKCEKDFFKWIKESEK